MYIIIIIIQAKISPVSLTHVTNHLIHKPDQQINHLYKVLIKPEYQENSYAMTEKEHFFSLPQEGR